MNFQTPMKTQIAMKLSQQTFLYVPWQKPGAMHCSLTRRKQWLTLSYGLLLLSRPQAGKQQKAMLQLKLYQTFWQAAKSFRSSFSPRFIKLSLQESSLLRISISNCWGIVLHLGGRIVSRTKNSQDLRIQQMKEAYRKLRSIISSLERDLSRWRKASFENACSDSLRGMRSCKQMTNS